MTIEQLKVKAYDAMKQVEIWQSILTQANQSIAKLEVEQKQPKAEETPTVEVEPTTEEAQPE